MGRKKDKERVGDVLGLGDIANTSVRNQEPSLRHESDEAQRRQRMSEGADELTPVTPSPHQGGRGATGIDMGSGGEGTDIE